MSTAASLIRVRTSASAAVLAAALSALPAVGQTWLPTAGGSYDYNNGANWSTGAVPNGIGATVNLNGNILDTQNIYVYGSTTFGTMNIGDSGTGSAGNINLFRATTYIRFTIDPGAGSAAINSANGFNGVSPDSTSTSR